MISFLCKLKAHCNYFGNHARHARKSNAGYGNYLKRSIRFVTVVLFLILVPGLYGQQIIVQPFLQQATANSIWIVWETNQGTESLVEFGASAFALNQSETGAAISNVGSSVIHQVKLTGLQPQTRYYYRVKTGAASSEIFDFRTPPPSDSGYPVRFAAYSDSQFDSSNPTKHQELVNEGIIDYVTQNFSPTLAEALDFVVIPGDLVSNGNTHSHWTSHFFGQAQSLYRHVPLYPVTGNHEVDSPIYFRYFNLPSNGTPGFLEHWYFHDCGNVRIIGLDSNSGYRITTQLNWLSEVLAETATNDQIDFVFAQLHHPHKSELWTPGNTDYTGEVISRLEQFTTASGKPSVHFFGHTHGYSRGQSRDHQHLWVNVASGGGNIDYWGEFPIADYPEFQISTPDYGFMIVESEAGDDPRFVMKRFSRGNEVISKDNELVDTVTIRRNNLAPQTPVGFGCSASGQVQNPSQVVLEASSFEDPDGDLHLASHFQVARSDVGFSNPERDLWIRKENWFAPPGAAGIANGYFSVNTVTDPNIEQVKVTGLQPNSEYVWRVRYRDDSLTWSSWSATNSFTTGDSVLGPNLLQNPGAEAGVAGWDVVDGPLESLTDGQCNSGTSPASGSRFFAVGGVCDGESDYGEAFQTIDVSNLGDSINAGQVIANFGGFARNFNGTDRPEIWLAFRSPALFLISETQRLPGTSPQWTELASSVTVPGGTHFVEFHISGTRLGGNDNDSYLDDLYLQIGVESAEENLKGDVNQDGEVNLLDVQPFVDLLSVGEFQFEADLDCDGDVDLLDIAPFVTLISG